MGETAKYYQKNRAANQRRLKQQARYNKTKKGLALRVNANKLNRKLGTYGNGDGKDATHTGPNKGYTGSASANRAAPHLKSTRKNLKIRK
jgi:hypothetical protein